MHLITHAFPSTSGYLAAVFARLTGEEGRVVGIDYLKPLAELSEKNVCQDDPSLLSSNRVVLLHYFDIYFYTSSNHDLTHPSSLPWIIGVLRSGWFVQLIQNNP